MSLNKIPNWPRVRKIFARSFSSSFHYAIASLNEDGTPHVTPIGSLLLDKKEPKGVYFDIFASQLRKNVEANAHVSILAVDSGRMFWLRSLFKGKFVAPPGIRLNGKAGKRRSATPEEIRRWKKKTGFLSALRGYSVLWGTLTHVREIEFESCEEIRMGTMTT